MSNTNDIVKVTFHDTSGKTMNLSAKRSDFDDEIFKRLNPIKVFDPHPLMFSLPDSLVVMPTAYICRIDLSGPDLPQWPYVLGAQSVEQVDFDDVRALYDPAAFAAARKAAWNKPGSQQIGYTEYVLVNGDHLVWEVGMKSIDVTPTDIPIYIHRLLSVDGLHARTKDGGVTMINPKHIKRVAFHPGPSERPTGALIARREPPPPAAS